MSLLLALRLTKKKTSWNSRKMMKLKMMTKKKMRTSLKSSTMNWKMT